MPGHFDYNFSARLPRTAEEREWDNFDGLPTLESVIHDATEAISAVEQFRLLPGRNQDLITSMATQMLGSANKIAGSDRALYRRNESGLYLIGSRARGEAGPDSDVDVLSVGTFFRDQGFLGFYNGGELGQPKPEVFDGFDIEVPEELPNNYNIGLVDRKYLVRATPQGEGLPVDLSVVDLTHAGITLDKFKAERDTGRDGEPLVRIPLLEVTVEEYVPVSLVPEWTATIYDFRA